MEFKIGDIVKLKSGSPLMTIYAIRDEPEVDNEGKPVLSEHGKTLLTGNKLYGTVFYMQTAEKLGSMPPSLRAEVLERAEDSPFTDVVVGDI